MAHTHEYDCKVCGAHLDSRQELDQHNREHHSSGARSGDQSRSASSSISSSSNSPRVAGFGGNIKAAGFDNPLVWLGILVAPAVAFAIYHTPFGLRVRAAGEHPDAAESVGVSVKRVRYIAVIISGVLAALGGIAIAQQVVGPPA